MANRDVLTLDIEIDPTQIIQQTDMARETIARNLSNIGPGFATGGFPQGPQGPIVGGVYGGLNPVVPTYAPEGMMRTAWQSTFPSMYAPLTTTVDQYQQALQASLAQRASYGLTEGLVSASKLGAEGIGMAGGTALGVWGAAQLGAALGTTFGLPGTLIGGGIGAIAGATFAGGAFDFVTKPLVQGARETVALENTIRQEGYRAGLGHIFSTEKNAAELASQLREDSSRDPILRAHGLNAREFTATLLQEGIRNNLFEFQSPEQFNHEEFVGQVKAARERVLDIMRTFKIAEKEAIDVLGEMRRAGGVTTEDQTMLTAMAGEAFRYNLHPTEVHRMAAQAGQMAQAQGLPGVFGEFNMAREVLRINAARQQRFDSNGNPIGTLLGADLIARAGGVQNIAAEELQLTARDLQDGGILRSAMMAATTPEGGVDVDKLRSLRGKHPLEIMREANQNLLSSGDPFGMQNQFDFNYEENIAKVERADPDLFMTLSMDQALQQTFQFGKARKLSEQEVMKNQGNLMRELMNRGVPKATAQVMVRKLGTEGGTVEELMNRYEATLKRDTEQRTGSFGAMVNAVRSDTTEFLLGGYDKLRKGVGSVGSAFMSMFDDDEQVNKEGNLPAPKEDFNYVQQARPETKVTKEDFVQLKDSSKRALESVSPAAVDKGTADKQEALLNSIKELNNTLQGTNSTLKTAPSTLRGILVSNKEAMVTPPASGAKGWIDPATGMLNPHGIVSGR